MDQTLKDQVSKLFNFIEPLTQIKLKTPYRIKVDGRFIYIGNKRKSVWPCIGAAKSSLRLHLSYRICPLILTHQNIPADFNNTYSLNWNRKNLDQAWDTFLKVATDSGFLEFIPLQE